MVAVRHVSFEIAPGEILPLLGPSGSRKTATLRMIMGPEEPESREVLVNGKSVLGLPPHPRNIGPGFQDLTVFARRAVFE